MKNSITQQRDAHVAVALATLGLLAATAWPARAVVTVPPTLSISRDGANVTITVKGAPQTAYSFCSSLTGERSGAWSQMTTVTADASGTATFTDGVNTGLSQQFYAVVQGDHGTTGQIITLDATNIYSQNVVGYVNVVCPPGFSLIANPLNASPNNNLTNVVKNIPYFTTFSIFNPATGFATYVYDDIDGTWIPNSPTPILAPGGGGFIRNYTPTNFTVTFVGEVLQGSLTNSMPAGKAIVSSKVPQTGNLNLLQFPGRPNDLVHVYNNLTGYATYVFDDLDFTWIPGDPAGPTIPVGSAFFAQQSTPKFWVRNFTVQ